MSTAANPVVEAPKKVSKIPPLNPWAAPAVACPNKGCNKILYPVISDNPKGGEKELRYDCEPCGYSFYASLQHVQGQCKPLGAPNKSLPEIFEKGA